ncbi:MAG: hypothetical protein Q8S33_21875 [Myxococcales bacterium]|nr:hypothetical protein [Myxococcales bacterium]MDP3502997.1 hypothetical protein [Myxococcales bacterium]
MPTGTIVFLVIAAVFAALTGLCLNVWWRVVSSPGDDNPVGGLAMLAGLVFGALAIVSAVIALVISRRG